MPITGHIIAQVVLARTTGLPEDVVTNTFHFFDATGSYASNVGLVATALQNFYNTPPSPATTFPISNFINATISRSANACKVNCYDGGLPPLSRVPTTTVFTLGAAAGSNALPDETALCLSFKSTNIPSVPPPRKRGRVYIGPLNYDAVSGVSSGDSRPDATLTSRLLNAGKAMTVELATGGATWCVYSPTVDGLFEITDLWVDNAFDVQRRRGAKATTRSTLTI